MNIKNIFKNKLIYFILCAFFLWYVFPYIPLNKVLNAVPKTFVYHNFVVGIIIIISMILSTIINMFVQFGLVFEMAKLRLNYKKLILLCFVSVIFIVLCVIWIEHYLIITKPEVFAHKGNYLSHLLIVCKNIGSKFIGSLPQRGFINFFIIVLSFAFGSLLSYIVREKNLLVPVMICCAFIDIWTCTQGFVSKVIAKTPEIVSGVSSGVSMLGGSNISIPILATIGPGDFIFSALVFSVVIRFNMNSRKTFWYMFGFLTFGMLLIVLGLLPILPALICVALGTIIANRKEFNLNKSEKSSVATVFLLLLIILIIFKFVVK